MNGTVQWGRVSVWHHRILGGLWVLCGVAFIASLIASHSWDSWENPCVGALVGAAYIFAAIGFIFGRTWARRTIGVLTVIAELFSMDMLLMFGVHSNRQGIYGSLAAMVCAGYTMVFLALSAAWHSQESRERGN
jgi:hypothetical protein